MKLENLDEYAAEMARQVREYAGDNPESDISCLHITIHDNGIDISGSDDLSGTDRDSQLKKIGIAASLLHIVLQSTYPPRTNAVAMPLSALLGALSASDEGAGSDEAENGQATH
jgi:hypothetical protein